MVDKRELIPAEDSVPLRLVVYLMTMTCILASCIFIKTSWPVIILGTALASIGSVVSYQNRNSKQNWMQWVVIVGVLAVGANAGAEFMDPTNGASDFWGPIVHFVAGTFALHTFDLKSRADINLSALLGALILCFLSPVVRSLYFGLAVFNYICLGTVMLYFDCMSRSLHNWLQKPMLPAPMVDVASISGRRKPRGSVYLTVALLPIISAFCFLLLPRSDNLVDTILSNLKHIDFGQIFKLIPGVQPSMPNVDVPRHEYDPKKGKNIEFKKKQFKDNKDELDEAMKKANVETRKIVKVKENKPKEDKKDDKKDPKKKDPKKGKPAGPPKSQKKKAPSAHADDPTKRVKNGRTKDNKMGLDNLDLDTDPPDSPVLVFKVNSTRLFYSRRTVFDEFDGRKWKRSKSKLKATDIEIKDPNAVNLKKDPNAPNPQEPASADKELTPEQEAEKELQQEKLNDLSKRDTGFGPDMAVDYVFSEPSKDDFRISQASALRLPAKLPCVTLNQNFEVATDIDDAFPSAWLAQDLTYKGKKIIVDDYGQIINSEKIKKGAKFNISSQWPVYNLQAMRSEPGITEERENAIRSELANYLELPDNLSDEVLDIANAYAGNNGNWFVIAERICLQMRTACTMEIDKPIDYKPADDRVKDFLIDRKLGNDKDFTTAYVMLCRGVGLPARVVYGFNPGNFNKETGTQDIHMTDATSWAEVFIPDYGWVPFDPTPEGVMPGVKRDEGFSFWKFLKWLCSLLGISLDDEGFTPKTILALVSIGFSVIFLLVGLVIGIMLFLKWRRDRRDRNPWQDGAWRVWNDLARDFKKARMERMPTETPTEFVDRINKIIGDQRREGAMSSYELPQLLKEFFVTYEAVHFGNKEGLPILKSQAQELKKLVKANKTSEKSAEAASKAVRGPRR